MSEQERKPTRGKRVSVASASVAPARPEWNDLFDVSIPVVCSKTSHPEHANSYQARHGKTLHIAVQLSEDERTASMQLLNGLIKRQVFLDGKPIHTHQQACRWLYRTLAGQLG